jgi:hypothetical protein
MGEQRVSAADVDGEGAHDFVDWMSRRNARRPGADPPHPDHAVKMLWGMKEVRELVWPESEKRACPRPLHAWGKNWESGEENLDCNYSSFVVVCAGLRGKMQHRVASASRGADRSVPRARPWFQIRASRSERASFFEDADDVHGKADLKGTTMLHLLAGFQAWHEAPRGLGEPMKADPLPCEEKGICGSYGWRSNGPHAQCLLWAFGPPMTLQKQG